MTDDIIQKRWHVISMVKNLSDTLRLKELSPELSIVRNWLHAEGNKTFNDVEQNQLDLLSIYSIIDELHKNISLNHGEFNHFVKVKEGVDKYIMKYGDML